MSRKKTRFLIECRCGCGEIIETPNDRGREKRYKKGHNRRGASSPWVIERNKKAKKVHIFVDGIEGKICSTCKEWKTLSDFGSLKCSMDGLAHRCKDCLRTKTQRYRTDNPEKIEGKRKTAEYRKTRREYHNRKRATDINYRLKCNLRSRLHSAIKGNVKSGHILDLIGCTINKLKKYLEARFQEGMTWKNWGVNGWHIDHIVPCAAFDFSIPEHQKRCFNYTNLQPLWAADNWAKSDTIPEGVDIAWKSE